VTLYVNLVKSVEWHILTDTHKTTCFSPSFCFHSFHIDEPLLLPFPVRAVVVALPVGFASVFILEVELSSIR
jgi:hypothetical protein